MFDQFLWTILLKGLAALIAAPLTVLTAVIVVVVLLRFFDRSAGINWKTDVMPKLMEDPNALAHYMARRYGSTVLAIGLGVGLAVGLALS